MERSSDPDDKVLRSFHPFAGYGYNSLSQGNTQSDRTINSSNAGNLATIIANGKEFRSIEFADWVEKKMHTVNKRLVFIIGGPYGFAPKVYEAAQEKISLSKMTFSHQMIRLIFVEQLYRAMTILNNNPYHHE